MEKPRWWSGQGEAGPTLSFIDRWPIKRNFVEQSVRKSTFQAMRSVEEGGRASHASLRQRGGEGDVAAFKVREGKVGGYLNHLSAEDIKFIDGATQGLRDELANLYSS